MLSIPGFRNLIRSRDVRQDHEDWFAEFFAGQRWQAQGLRAYLIHLARSLRISLLGVLDVDCSGKAAVIRVAGGDGRFTELAVPDLEGGGLMAGLVGRAEAAAGKARVFSRQEVFPKDGTWCDLIPMDSVVAYVFVPLEGLPFCDVQAQGTSPCKSRYLLAVEDTDSGAESLLPLKAMVSASLVGVSLALKAREKDHKILAILRSILRKEGYSIGFADDNGDIIEEDGSGFAALKADQIKSLREQIVPSDQAAGGAQTGPGKITTQEQENLRVSTYPVVTNGTASGHLVVVKECDFTSQIRNRRERLKLLSRFISSIAHEIKNPLTGISAGVQYLAKKMQSGVKEDETVDFILSEISRLNRIVDDLYKVAKPPQLTLAQIDVNQIVGRSLICLSEDITRKRLTVTQSLDKAMPEIEADSDRLQQILLNIIKNAIEASPEGGALHIETCKLDSAVHIRVGDQGPGIGPEEREKIFEPFYSTKERGSGLGLCICQRIVDEHGGTIRVEPREGGGTSFVIELPIGR